MARITRVKSAQQRYATKPTIDPTTGEQKVVPVMGRNGEQKKSKRGPVVRRLTERDLTKPLPMPKCDFSGCGKTIEVGQPYMHITPKSGPYGGSTRYRCGNHPGWNVWEYSYSTSARVAQVTNDIDSMLADYDFTDESSFEDAKLQAAEMAAELRDEKEEALGNMPEGLQDGSVAQEQHEALESWVDEIENASAPDEADTTCPECSGAGQVDNPEASDDEDAEDMVDCEECDGTGEVEVSEEFADACREAIMDAVNNCYV